MIWQLKMMSKDNYCSREAVVARLALFARLRAVARQSNPGNNWLPRLAAPQKARGASLAMTIFLQIAAVVLCLTTTACATISGIGKDNAPPPSPLIKFSPQKNIATLWSTRVGSGANRSHIRFDTVVQNGIVYTVDSSGNVTAVNAANGRVIWSTTIKGCPSSGPAVQFGCLVFGMHNGEVVVLNSHNGGLIWRRMMSTQVLAPPSLAGRWVLVKTVDGKLTALDRATGRPCWDFTHKAPLMILQSDSAPIVSRGVVFVGFGDGQIFALGLQTGRVLWQQAVALPRGLGELDSMVDIIADPVASDSVVFVAAYQGKLAALSKQTGQMIWQCNVSTYHNLAIRGSLIVVTDDQGVIWAINRFNGQVFWQQKALLYRELTAPLIIGNQIWVGDAEGYLHVLSSRNGCFIARCLIDSSGLFVQPVFDRNGVLVRSSGGDLVKVL